MSNVIPCDDCGKPIDVGHLGKRNSGDRFVCRACQKKYADIEKLAKALESQLISRAVH